MEKPRERNQNFSEEEKEKKHQYYSEQYRNLSEDQIQRIIELKNFFNNPRKIKKCIKFPYQV